MADVHIDFLSEHPERVKEHLRHFFEAELRDHPGEISISVRYGSHGWRVVEVVPAGQASEVRRLLYRAGGGQEQRGGARQP